MSTMTFEPMSLPKFNAIKTDAIEDSVKKILEICESKLKQIEENAFPSWDAIMEPLDEIQIAIHQVWSPISHLHSVKNTEELRTVYAKIIEPMTSFYLRMGQSTQIHKALCQLKESTNFSKLTDTKKRILEKKLLQSKLSGIGLPEKEKQKFNDIAKELSKLSTTFSNNVLDAVKEYSLTITEVEDLGKLPESYKELASLAYNNKNSSSKSSTTKKGPWLVTLDHTSFSPFMENSPNRNLRKDLYLAFIQKASSGKFDNTQNINRILELRKSQAKLLGFSSYAELSLASKMAESVSQIYTMADNLLQPSKKKAEKELTEIKNFAASNSKDQGFFHWDLSYWSKRLQEKKYNFEEDELKPYFSFDSVAKGLFDLAENIFSIKVKPSSNKDVQLWDEHVAFYDIFDQNDDFIASFYLDPYSRPQNKRGGAWMDTCVSRRKEKNGKITRPVAYLVCNFTPPAEETPSLLTFREAETLFHEFGHGLQHMLTNIEDLEASGINGVEWDTVELPSQFMENWCYHKETLLNMAKHYKTGETLPEELYQKLINSKNYMAALQTLRQLQFALIDLNLHHEYEPSKNNSPFNVQKEIADKVLTMKPLDEDRFLCSFGHIFSGGYSAGYYSYKWAEILSADAFSLFEEKDMTDKEEMKKIGMKFRETVLGLGGSLDPMTIYKKFRGRGPSTDALLKHRGLL